jgi:hypothetical protein
MKSMDFFVWQGAGGVNSELFTTSATQPGGKRHGFMARYGLGLVLRRKLLVLQRPPMRAAPFSVPARELQIFLFLLATFPEERRKAS